MTNKNVIISELFDLYEFHFVEMVQVQKSIEVLTGKKWSEVSSDLREQSANQFIADCTALIEQPDPAAADAEPMVPKRQRKASTRTFPAIPCEICETMFHPFRKNQTGCSEKCQKILSNRKQRARQRQAIALLTEKKAPLPPFEPNPDENLLISRGPVKS